MADHNELVAEMLLLEQMGNQERQKLAKKRRLQQLKKWGQREKEWIAKEKQINKRLANLLNEENNGLNLKNYTTYGSNNRTKKKISIGNNKNNVSPATAQQTNNAMNNNSNNNNNNNNDILHNNNNTDHKESNKIRFRANDTQKITPHGRVQFNVGVMLLEAAARNDYDEVKRLLMLGVSPDSVNHDGLTALHQCCIDASEPMMNLLLQFGANVDARDTEQWTPLHAACTCGHLNLVKILVEHEADLLAVNGDGNMPFDICEDEATLDYIESQMVKRNITQEMIDITRASTEMKMLTDIETLVADGKDLNTPTNENGVTLLHIAASNGYLSVVKFLLKHGADVNACDNDQWRPLHGAACWGTEQHSKVIELLIESGAHLDSKTVNDETVFDLCDNAELLEKLNQIKDEIESKQASGADRLKRTQSRTNSRVHSVRRTSVRDKNQISRREAREEALLRVESNSLNGSTTVTPGDVVDVAIGEAINQAESIKQPPEVKLKNGDTETNKQTVNEKTLEDKAPIDKLQPNIGRQSLTDFSETNESKQLTSRSQSSSNYTSSDSIGEKRSHLIRQTSLDLDNSLSTTSVSTDPRATKNIFEQNTSASQPIQVKSSKLPNSQKSEQKAVTLSSNKTDNINTACDQSNSTRLQPQVVQQLTVQLAPINYTLSNLKKQRSDLRMRTTSIGGGISSNSIKITNGSLASINGQQHVVIDPQANGLSVNGKAFRPESPSLTIRKFHGEPSEAIGGKNSRYKCCILI